MGVHFVVPVGWGQLNVLGVDGEVIVTDGGTIHVGVERSVSWRAMRNWRLAAWLSGFYISRRRWLISHLDYDHYSIVATDAENNDVDFDICYFPGVYLESACREAAAQYLALLALVAYLEVGLRPRGEALRSILRRCRVKMGLLQGDTLDFDGVEYRILWPSLAEARRLCGEARKHVLSLAERYCGKQKRIPREECLREFEGLLHELRRLTEELGSTLERAPGPSRAERADGEAPGPPRSEHVEDSAAEWLYKRLPVTGEVASALGRIDKEAGRLLLSLARRYTNITSIAYAAHALDAEAAYKLDYRNLHSPPCWPCAGSTLYPPLCAGYYPHRCARHCCLGCYYLVYLADLEGRALGSALNYLYNLGPNTRAPLALVAPHHGTAWHSLLGGLKPFITVISQGFHPRLRGMDYKREYHTTSIHVLITWTRWGLQINV